MGRPLPWPLEAELQGAMEHSSLLGPGKERKYVFFSPSLSGHRAHRCLGQTRRKGEEVRWSPPRVSQVVGERGVSSISTCHD